MTAQILAFPHKQRPSRYILQNDNPTPVYQRELWMAWMAQHGDKLRRVDERDGVFVLTEFVGLDQSIGGEPALWKTIVLTENIINPLHGLCWSFAHEADASWFHDYVLMCISMHRGEDLERLYDELATLAPQVAF